MNVSKRKKRQKLTLAWKETPSFVPVAQAGRRSRILREGNPPAPQSTASEPRAEAG